jgi:peptidoglycan L-alanyl-D-glutamate endopeptidase CwlK
METAPEPTDTDLKLEQAQEDLRLKRVETELKLAELKSRQEEKPIKSLISSPLTITLITGILALTGSLIVNVFQSAANLKLEREKFVSNQKLEQNKAESDLIIQAIKTADPDASAKNLLFLLKLSLIKDRDGKIAELEQHPENAPVLSATSDSAEAGSSAIVYSNDLPSFTVESVSKLLPEVPRDNIEKNLPFILGALEGEGLRDREMVLATLAFIRINSPEFKPISELPGPFNTSSGGQPFDLYDARQGLGNQGAPDGANYKSRGFIGILGRANYKMLSEKLGLGNELVENPEKANDPEVAAKIAVAYIKTKEKRVRILLEQNDLKTLLRQLQGGSTNLDQFIKTFVQGRTLIKKAPSN